MTTFHDDSIRVVLETGARIIPCEAVGLTWPPPERLVIENGAMRIANHDDDGSPFVLVRSSMSIITDEQRLENENVARCAIYEYETQSAGARV